MTCTSDLPAGLARVLLTEAQILDAVEGLGQRISADHTSRVGPMAPLVVVGILKGSLYFLADLTRRIHVPLQVDFLTVSSYGSATRSSGNIRILTDLSLDIAGRHVLVVEDIVDSGRSLDSILRALRERQPASLRVCTLLDKPARREVEVAVDYVGFTVPDAFVVGYGLDLDQHFRNLPYIAVCK